MSAHPTLTGRGAVVVGATSGIGHAVATTLARHGAGVVVNGRTEDTVARAVDILTRDDHRAVGTAGDAADETVAAALVDTCLTAFGAIDILVNCAGIAEHHVRAKVICPGAKTRLSSGAAYEAGIRELNRRGMLDDISTAAALDAPPADYVAPLYLYLASDAATSITGQIFVAAGGFVGRYDRPQPTVLGFRDHTDTPPWSPNDLHRMITGGDTQTSAS